MDTAPPFEPTLGFHPQEKTLYTGMIQLIEMYIQGTAEVELETVVRAWQMVPHVSRTRVYAALFKGYMHNMYFQDDSTDPEKDFPLLEALKAATTGEYDFAILMADALMGYSQDQFSHLGIRSNDADGHKNWLRFQLFALKVWKHSLTDRRDHRPVLDALRRFNMSYYNCSTVLSARVTFITLCWWLDEQPQLLAGEARCVEQGGWEGLFEAMLLTTSKFVGEGLVDHSKWGIKAVNRMARVSGCNTEFEGQRHVHGNTGDAVWKTREEYTARNPGGAGMSVAEMWQLLPTTPPEYGYGSEP